MLRCLKIALREERIAIHKEVSDQFLLWKNILNNNHLDYSVLRRPNISGYRPLKF